MPRTSHQNLLFYNESWQGRTIAGSHPSFSDKTTNKYRPECPSKKPDCVVWPKVHSNNCGSARSRSTPKKTPQVVKNFCSVSLFVLLPEKHRYSKDRPYSTRDAATRMPKRKSSTGATAAELSFRISRRIIQVTKHPSRTAPGCATGEVLCGTDR